MRAGIDTALYPYPGGPREPYTMLFLGSFRHTPNQVALDWFGNAVLPLIVAKLPRARLLVAGSDPPQRHAFHDPSNAIDLLGFVEDIQPLFSACALFVCPIRSGSGVRVKLLEAFANGIPVVSTRLGAEGLARADGEFCGLADDAESFAARAVELLQDSARASAMAARARKEVEDNWDMPVITRKLVCAIPGHPERQAACQRTLKPAYIGIYSQWGPHRPPMPGRLLARTNRCRKRSS